MNTLRMARRGNTVWEGRCYCHLFLKALFPNLNQEHTNFWGHIILEFRVQIPESDHLNSNPHSHKDFTSCRLSVLISDMGKLLEIIKFI
jgi:hypothetical protein